MDLNGNGVDSSELGLESGLEGPRDVGKQLNPEGPSTQYLRTLFPKAIKGLVFGTRVLKK